jgi:O-antigen/teichoic acid export membrane protein
MVFSSFFSQALVGHYGFAMRMVQLPLTLLGTAIAQVFLQRGAAQRGADGSLGPLVEKMFRQLVVVGSLPLALVALIGPELFQMVFGSEWVTAGQYASILALPLFMNFVSGTLPLFTLLERQEASALFMTLVLFARTVPFIVGGAVGMSVDSALIIFALLNAVVWLGLSFWQFSASGADVRAIPQHLGKTALHLTPTVLVVALAKWVIVVGAPVLLFVAFAGVGLYGILVWRHDCQTRVMWQRIYRSVRGEGTLKRKNARDEET